MNESHRICPICPFLLCNHTFSPANHSLTDPCALTHIYPYLHLSTFTHTHTQSLNIMNPSAFDNSHLTCQQYNLFLGISVALALRLRKVKYLIISLRSRQIFVYYRKLISQNQTTLNYNHLNLFTQSHHTSIKSKQEFVS